jgi:hypothetical protein
MSSAAEPAEAWPACDAAELDSFFEKDGNVLKSYRFDYDLIVEWERATKKQTIIEQCLWPCCLPCSIYESCYYCLYGSGNIDAEVKARHLAISRDGIRYVVDKYTQKQCACFPNVVSGKVSKTVPYDKMTDCDVEEPAGASFICGLCWPVPQTLHIVQVDTASGSGKMEGGHELSLKGLVDPFSFKRDVWAMKRGEPVDGVEGSVAPLGVCMVGEAAAAGGMDSSTSFAPLMQTMQQLLEVNKKQLDCLMELKAAKYGCSLDP